MVEKIYVTYNDVSSLAPLLNSSLPRGHLYRHKPLSFTHSFCISMEQGTLIKYGEYWDSLSLLFLLLLLYSPII